MYFRIGKLNKSIDLLLCSRSTDLSELDVLVFIDNQEFVAVIKTM